MALYKSYSARRQSSSADTVVYTLTFIRNTSNKANYKQHRLCNSLFLAIIIKFPRIEIYFFSL